MAVPSATPMIPSGLIKMMLKARLESASARAMMEKN
jgi:hypothetical protein